MDMITMTDAEALEMQDFLNRAKTDIEALAAASAGWQARAEAADADVVAYKAELAAYKSELARVSQMALDNEAKLLAVRETLAGVIDERNEAQAEVARLRDELAVMEAKYRETLRRYAGDL
jgi:chromosome segregation ATPase